MSILNPTKSTIQSALLRHAAMLTEKAERLKAYAESMGEMSEEQFMEHLGSEYSGPGFVRQIEEEVGKASEVRPSDMFPIRHALMDLFAKAQRAEAVKPPSQS